MKRFSWSLPLTAVMMLLISLQACGGSSPNGFSPTGNYTGNIAVQGPATVTVGPREGDSYPAVATSDVGNAALSCAFIAPTGQGYNFRCAGKDTVDTDGDGNDDQVVVLEFTGLLDETQWEGEFVSGDISALPFTLQRESSAPSGVRAVTFDDYIEVSWRDNSVGESGFAVLRAESGAALREIARVGPNETSYLDYDVDSQESYSYAVEVLGAGQVDPVEIEVPVSLKVRHALSVRQVNNPNGFSGRGTIFSDPEGITCTPDLGESCRSSFGEGVEVTLKAEPERGYAFVEWGGACEGRNICVITMDRSTEVTAAFAVQELERRLEIELTGAGGGIVTSEPAGINCGSDCSETFEVATTVTLQAQPDDGSVFVGWGGFCSGAAECSVPVNGLALVEAEFAPASARRYQLTVRLGDNPDGPNGRGTITSQPAGITCTSAGGAGCQGDFSEGQTVSLSAQPDEDFAFVGWQGDCSGDSCEVAMDDDKTVTAIFGLPESRLRITKAGSGDGTVVSDPAGIDCGEDCEETFNGERDLTLTATPDSNSIFGGWTGCDSTDGLTCEVSVSTRTNVTAQFERGSAPQINSFGASTETLARGDEVILSWDVSSNEQALEIALEAEGEVIREDLSRQGSVTLDPDDTTTYRLTAANAFGEAEAKTVTVTVGDAPRIVSFDPEDSTVLAGDEVTLSWDVTGDDLSVQLNGEEVGEQDNRTVTIDEATSYTLSVSSPFGSVPDVTRTFSILEPPVITSFGGDLDDGDLVFQWDVESAEPLTKLRLTLRGNTSIELSPTATDYTFSNVPSAGTYTFILEAVNRAGATTRTVDIMIP